jgi:hypothetical protein
VSSRSDFQQAYSGRLISLLSWEQLTAFWQRIDADAAWYLYAVGEAPPSVPADADSVARFVRDVDALLHRDHRESYCGIVYADDLVQPSFIKIYDPNNLGSSCGVSKHPPLPGWIMSLAPPEELNPARQAPESRRRWWQSLQGS